MTYASAVQRMLLRANGEKVDSVCRFRPEVLC